MKRPPKERPRLADALTRPCATCGALPTGRFPDGSPSYSCHKADPERHKPIYPT